MEQAPHSAVAGLDFAQAGAILADMIVSYLAAGSPPFEPEVCDADVEDNRATPVANCVHLHSPIDTGTTALQPGEHGAPIQSEAKGRAPRLDPETHSDSRPGSLPVRCADDPPGGLQGAVRRRGDGSSRCDLRLGGVALG